MNVGFNVNLFIQRLEEIDNSNDSQEDKESRVLELFQKNARALNELTATELTRVNFAARFSRIAYSNSQVDPWAIQQAMGRTRNLGNQHPDGQPKG